MLALPICMFIEPCACLRSQYACLSNRVRACACMFIEPCACLRSQYACLSNRVHACAPNMHVYRTVCVLALPRCMFIEPCACLRLHVYRTVCVLALACLSNRVRPAYHASQHTGTLPGDVRPEIGRATCRERV